MAKIRGSGSGRRSRALPVLFLCGLIPLLVSVPLNAADVVTEGDMEDTGTTNWPHADILGTNTSDENATDQVGGGARSLRGRAQNGNRALREWFNSQPIGTIDQGATVSLSLWYGRQHFVNTQAGATIQFWVDIKPSAGTTWSNIWTSGDLGNSTTFQSATLTNLDVSGSFTVTQAYDLRLRISGKTGRDNAAYFVGWWDNVVLDVAAGANTTTLGDGTDPAAAPSLCPGDAATMLDAFSFVTDGNSDVVDDVTVGLSAGSAAGLSKIEITSEAGATVYGEVDNPATDTVVVALTLNTLTATSTSTEYRVRVTPKTHASMAAPPGSLYTVTGTVTSFTPNANTSAGSDADSDTVTIDNDSPAGATFTGCTGISASQIDLTWNNPVDADFDSVVVVRGPAGGTCPGFSPTEGTTYSPGSQGADEIVYVGSLESFSDTTGLAESTAYCYEVWAYDGCVNYFEGPPSSTTCSTLAAGNTTTLGNGTDPSASPLLCPGEPATMLDAFSFITDGNSDNVDNVTVSLSANTGEALGLLEITSADGVTVYGQVTDPASDTPTVDLSAPPVLTASSSLTEYRVRITPRTHAAMPVPQGSSYTVGGTISAFSPATNSTAGSDGSSDTVTIDNLSPNNSSWGTITPGDSQVVLNWTINDGVEVIVVRKSVPPPINDAPVEGADYTGQEGTAIGASTIVYVGSGTTVIDTGVVNNTNYYYKIFARDACFNYSTGVQDGPYAPTAPNNGTTTQAASASVDACDQITVTAPFTGDDNNNGSTLFESGPSGTGPWTTVSGCASLTGPSPRVCVDVNVAESTTYHYQVTFSDSDGVSGLNPRTTGPHVTPACAANDTTVIDDSAEASTCRQITSSSLFSGDANGDGWTQVEYNTAATWPGTVACDQATGPSPRQCVIPELTPGDSYWLRFTYSDPDGVNATAPPNPHQIGPIAVPACGADEAAPTVLVLSPRRDATVGGTDRVKVQVYDPNLSTVEWSVNSENDLDLAAAAVNSNYTCGTDCAVYEFDLDTTGLANDTHYLTIKATDAGGNIARVKQAFRVNNSGGQAAGDGNLLRRTRGSQLCIDCHNLPTHSSQSISHDYGNWAIDCLTCHTPHRTKNIFLIEDSVQTPNSGDRSVDLRNLSGVSDYGLAEAPGGNGLDPGVGLCETCHTRTRNTDNSPRYRNTGEGGNGHSSGACITCHTHEGGFSGAGGACDGCHNAPPLVGKHGSHDEVGTVPSDYGNTASHATATEYGFACAKCHTGGHINDGDNNPTHDGSQTNPWQVEVVFDDTADPKNPTPPAAYTGTYNENQDQGPDDDWWSWSDGSCTNLYCHSRANPLGGTDAFATVTWDQATALGCTSCHDTAGAASNLSPAHRVHTDTAKYDFECLRCHVNTITAASNDAIADKIEHVDGEKDVLFDASGVNNSGGGYSGSPGYTCSDTYCHSDGTVQTPPYSSTSIAWNSTATCRSCHSGDATSAPTMDSGKHENHVNQASIIGTNYECATCHNVTVSAGDNEVITTFGNHVNGTSNVAGTLVDATYSGPTCTTSYCHSSGQAPNPPSTTSFEYYSTPDWFTATADALDCKGCHGRHSEDAFTSTAGEPNYTNDGAGTADANSHPRHVAAAGDCTNCHNTTTSNGTAILASAPHTDQARDVVIAPGFDTGDPNYTAGTKTCQNIACHGTGAPQWGDTLVCLDCHDGPDGGTLGDGTPNGVGDEWNNVGATGPGHGTSGYGDFATTGGANPSALGGCDYCHDLGSSHTPTAGNNPYRVRFSATDNSLCLQCHETGDSGIQVNSETTALNLIDSSLDVDTAHFGTKHATGEGGELCWDCHDPHGVPTNILMVKSSVSQSSDQYGVPGATVTVTFTDNTTAGQAVGRFTEDTNTPRQGICQACHDPNKPTTESTKYWRNDGTDDPDGQGGNAPVTSVHNAAKVCSECHFHTDNFKGAGGDCLGCHGDGSGAPGRRAVNNDFNDATRESHHVGNGGTYMGGALTNFDCVTCHAEGKVVSDGQGGFTTDTTGQPHQDDVINLRDADSATAFFNFDKDAVAASAGAAANWSSNNQLWREWTSGVDETGGATLPGNAGLDPFCLSCHDSDGATQTAATHDNSGTALNPFGDGTVTNEYDQYPRGRVVDIKSRVTGSPPPEGVYSRHAIRGQSTSIYTVYENLLSTCDGSTEPCYTMYEGEQGTNSLFTNMGTDENGDPLWNDTSVMGCADCHTVDGANTTTGNAHGSTSEYLLKDAAGGADEGTLTNSLYNCWRCHPEADYDPGDHTENSGDFQDYTSQTGYGPNNGRVPQGNTGGNLYAMACTNCHGGIVGGSGPSPDPPEFGTIHGTSQQFGVGADGGANPNARNAYRFTNGNSMRYFDPGNWDSQAYTCYTLSTTYDDEFGGCTKHSGGKGGSRSLLRELNY